MSRPECIAEATVGLAHDTLPQTAARRPACFLTLRLKTLLLSALAGSVMLASLYGLTRSFLLGAVQQLERTYIVQDLERIRATVATELDHLVMLARDYGYWDETLYFVQTGEAGYVRANLHPQSTRNLRVQLMMFADARGRVVHAQRMPGADQEQTLPAEAVETLRREYPKLLRQNPHGQGECGLVLLGETALLLAAVPIRDSSGTGPGHGTLLCARVLSPGYLGARAKLSLNQVRLEPVGRGLPESGALQVAGAEPVLHYLSAQRIAGLTTLTDLQGRAAIQVRLEGGRAVYQQGLTTMRHLLLLILLGGLTLLVTMLMSQERLVLTRLESLSESLRAIGRDPDPASRVQMSGNDELALLAQSVNATLDALEKSQRERRLSAERFREMANLLPDILFETDLEGRVTYANSAALASCGYALEDLARGLRLEDLVEPQELPQVRRDLLAVTRRLTRRMGIYHVRRHNGTSFLCETHVVPIMEADGRCSGARGVGRDISDREEVEQAQRMATVGQLAAGVAHEFNNLLGGMMGHAELCSQGCNECKLSGVVVRGGERGAAICRDLLRFARPRALTRTALAVEEPLEAALKMAERELRNAEIAVVREYESGGWRTAGDAAQLEQVFLNLIINACHAMSHGGTLTVRTSFEQPDQIVVRVCDTGAGIAPEHLPRIFEPFFTTKHEADVRVISGAGLGLSVTMGIVRAHGGTMQVSSELNQGSCFSIRLSTCTAETAALLSEEELALSTQMNEAGKHTVLLAEDDEAIRSTLESLLELKGYAVTIAENTADTVARLDEADFDLVISDYLMPGGGGREILKFLRETGKEPKVIMITGLADEALFRELTQSGVNRCLSKPFRLAVLLETIEEVLGVQP